MSQGLLTHIGSGTTSLCGTLQCSGTFRWVLDDYRPDVVHFHNIHEHISYRAISQTARSGVPSVITLRDCMSFDYGQYDGGVDPSDLSAAPAIRHKARPREQLRERRFRYNPFRNLVIRRELAKASARVTISRELERAVNANGILGTQVIPNGLDPVRYQWSDGAVAAFRRRHELDEREVIFWSGRVYPKKGAWQALKALQHIVAARPRALLLVAARQTDHMMHFLKASSEMDLTKHVQVTGWLEREELIAAYRASSVVIFPSIYLEAFGRVPLEAMACERPTVVTCFGGPPEVVEDGVTGYVVNPFDHRLFAERILHLLTDVDLADRMGRAGRVRFERHFKIDAIASRYISLFADAGATSTHHAAVS